jgi:hypothetical protein
MILKSLHNGFWKAIPTITKPLWWLLQEDSTAILNWEKQVRIAYVLKEEDLRRSAAILKDALKNTNQNSVFNLN